VKKESFDYVYNKMYSIGRAICRVNGNNTHSGNLSMRDPEEDNLFYITSSGSQCGALVPTDIVPLKFNEVSWGDARASTESTEHRKILQIPNSNAVVHAHYINATVTTFDTEKNHLFLLYSGKDEKGRDEYLFFPLDLYGLYIVGSVVVASYLQPVGSPEMEERIPKYLADNQLTIVKGHGPFARGTSPEDAFYRLSVLENSAELILNLRRRGVNVTELQKKIRNEDKEKLLPFKIRIFDDNNLSEREVQDETVIADFKQKLNYNYNHYIGAYGTGSMSQKVSADEMIYCPMSSVPEGLDFPLYRKKIKFDEDDDTDLKLHKLIYQNTVQNTCMITANALATSEGMVVLAEKYGLSVLYEENDKVSYKPEDHPVVTPIDAEAIYLNPRLGLVDIFRLKDMTPNNPILNMLRWYKGCCIVAGYGVVSTGDTTLEQAAHNASSAERIARFRTEVYINYKMLGGPSIEDFELKTL